MLIWKQENGETLAWGFGPIGMLVGIIPISSGQLKGFANQGIIPMGGEKLGAMSYHVTYPQFILPEFWVELMGVGSEQVKIILARIGCVTGECSKFGL
ncbi:MAG TPA: hypothetical protein IGS52_13925 [Oscillatoriaceae cyanobacterium M33_DOE_052]|uniref:Uncharacterized protein n=1 Tax=Planktothricoides sp. SpSt-374 TaxID=2282167 RepID=A0A7C3ZWH1_9CYAN|nr:hypothetical protein [Oscillatoriaceae cyanobacterium M33_DOE_052]